MPLCHTSTAHTEKKKTREHLLQYMWFFKRYCYFKAQSSVSLKTEVSLYKWENTSARFFGGRDYDAPGGNVSTEPPLSFAHWHTHTHTQLSHWPWFPVVTVCACCWKGLPALCVGNPAYSAYSHKHTDRQVYGHRTEDRGQIHGTLLCCMSLLSGFNELTSFMWN